MKFLNKITSIASACFLTLALTGCSDYLDVSGWKWQKTLH